MFEKFNITDRLKLKTKTKQTLMESLFAKLDIIRKEKDWTLEETGDNLALLLDPELAI